LFDLRILVRISQPASGKPPYVLATQIRHDRNDTSAISIVDTIAATTGSLLFNASLTLSFIKDEDWEPSDRNAGK
jgi:hypothetical protein